MRLGLELRRVVKMLAKHGVFSGTKQQ